MNKKNLVPNSYPIYNKDKDYSIELSSNIVLKLANSSFADEAYKKVDANRDYLQIYLPWVKSCTLESITDYLNSQFEESKKNNSKLYAIFLNKELVGMIGFNRLSLVNKSAEFGYYLFPEYFGKGFIHQSATALIQVFNQDLGLRRYIIKASVFNEASNKVAKRLGFSHEGVLRKDEALNGVYHDVNQYSYLIPDDYLEKEGQLFQ